MKKASEESLNRFTGMNWKSNYDCFNGFLSKIAINLNDNSRNTNEIVKQKEYNEEKSSPSPRPRLSTIDEGLLFALCYTFYFF
jgi:hypothetical protein